MIPLFSALAQKALEYLAGAVEDIHLTPGEYVAHEGESRFLAIVVEGKTELTKLVNGVEQVVGVRLPASSGRDPDDAQYAAAGQHARRRVSRVLKATVEVFHAHAWLRSPQRSVPPRWSAWRCSKRHRAAARLVMFVIGPRLDSGVLAVTASFTATGFYDRLDPD